MSIQLTVLGLNRTGVSIGLALTGHTDQILRIGSDTNVANEQKALKMGAFDKVVHNIPAAVEEADIVVLCLPADDIRKNIEIIAPVLKAGAVVLDTSPLKVAVNGWIKNLFPEERYLVSFSPTFNPLMIANEDDSVDQASAALFQKSLIAVAAPAGIHEDAIRLASDLATILGGKPYFTDPYEADGLLALSDLLPKLSSAALLAAVAEEPGWNEARKLAGHSFYATTEAVNHLDEQIDLGAAALYNSENAARVLGSLIEELQAIQEMIRNQDSDALRKTLEKAVETRQQWWKDRQKMDWEQKTDAPPLPTSGQMLGKLFGLGYFQKKKPTEKK